MHVFGTHISAYAFWYTTDIYHPRKISIEHPVGLASLAQLHYYMVIQIYIRYKWQLLFGVILRASILMNYPIQDTGSDKQEIMLIHAMCKVRHANGLLWPTLPIARCYHLVRPRE